MRFGVSFYRIAHIKIRNHCVVDIDSYLQKNADAPFVLSSKYMVCPDYLHRAANMDYCPSFLTCSPGYVLCDDNTCRKNFTLCPVTRVCSKYTCPFGNCVDDYTLCFSNTICKKGYRLCSDRLCHPRSRDCPSYIDDMHNDALLSGMKLCRSGDIVNRDILCPNNVRSFMISNMQVICPIGQFKCPDNTCRDSPLSCPFSLLCPAGAVPSLSGLFTSSTPVRAEDVCLIFLSAPRFLSVPPSLLCFVQATSACLLLLTVLSFLPVLLMLRIAVHRESVLSMALPALRESVVPPTNRISALTEPA